MGGVSSNPPTGSIACTHCGSAMLANAPFCPTCERSMRPLPAAERVAAAIAYLTLVPAAALLFLPAFRGSRFVRFHAFQSILLWGIFIVVTVIALFLSDLASLAMFFLWVVLTVKAWQGERFEVPFLGALAARLG
jgi:uncharacterized membrane protein